MGVFTLLRLSGNAELWAHTHLPLLLEELAYDFHICRKLGEVSGAGLPSGAPAPLRPSLALFLLFHLDASLEASATYKVKQSVGVWGVRLVLQTVCSSEVDFFALMAVII